VVHGGSEFAVIVPATATGGVVLRPFRVFVFDDAEGVFDRSAVVSGFVVVELRVRDLFAAQRTENER
jgi:hypothetical protein